ncbi:MAG: hypothetical protein K2N47_02915 [Clostridia bacterium]|nr:hypothetical protein [Clostridia bacterium]
MWNENGPLELLKGLPQVLTADNLAQIQKVIDDDKFVNSEGLEGDLCGQYAPFCRNCDKSVENPCAVAYVRMKIKEGMAVEMENISSEAPEEDYAEKPFKSTKIRIGVGVKKIEEN